MTSSPPLHIIGAGLAGSEAAFAAATAGVRVILHEMRPQTGTFAHQTGACAELVCSNSFRSDDSDTNAVGLLHWELRQGKSIILHAADAHQVPAGTALAVDRDGFAAAVTAAIDAHPNIERVADRLDDWPPSDWEHVIIATGPLTAEGLANAIAARAGREHLSFFDAIAPIIHAESLNWDRAWKQSRYDKVGPGGDGADYVNCPLEKDEYNAFLDAVLSAEYTDFKEWEKSTPYFEGCLPIEVMASRGRDTLRFGPMKPVGLTDPHTGRRPYAVVQLRQDNALGTLYNLVGFQTKMKYAEQIRVIRMIPGLENAQFARLGGIHRNTFIHSPSLLDDQLRFRSDPRVRFAGQITGVEGYVESAAMGWLAGHMAASEILGSQVSPPPPTTSMGALVAHITGGHVGTAKDFQPMNANFGLFPLLPGEVAGEKPAKGAPRGADRKKLLSARGKADFLGWLGEVLAGIV